MRSAVQGRALVPPAGYRQPAEQRRQSPARPGPARRGAERSGAGCYTDGLRCERVAGSPGRGGGGAATSDRRSGGTAGSRLGALGRLGAAGTASEGGSRVLRRGEATLRRALRRGNS